MTNEETWLEAERISEAPRDDDQCLAAALLLASSQIGPNQRRCAQFLGVPERKISLMAHNLRRSKIWRGGKVYHSGWDHETEGGINFILDMCVAIGWMERV